MIRLGLTSAEKHSLATQYTAQYAIQHIVWIAPVEPAAYLGEWIEYKEVIMYRTFYRLLQEIDNNTLVVIDECLRTQNRYSLEYNCIRQYLNQAGHVIVFQYLPLIDTADDFMILFDFATRSRWKREKFNPDLFDEVDICVRPIPISFNAIPVPTSKRTKKRYQTQRDKLLREVSNSTRDPHIIPRQLHLIGGADKFAHIKAGEQPQLALFSDSAETRRYVARNKRLKHPAITTFRDIKGTGQYTLVDMPHRFIDFTDFLGTTRQTTIDILVADLKVDHWYVNHYQQWQERLNATYANLRP
ncbi:MAG: hypothetical protein M9918_19455 [Anaerolineae bacterium]|nr:hypothetical protein [Anaerolineae bacterium]